MTISPYFLITVVLHLLRTHTCFNKLPKDIRTLLDTPRTRITTCDVVIDLIQGNTSILILK